MNADMTNWLIRDAGTLSATGLSTREAVEGALSQIAKMLFLANEDQADELALPGPERDQVFLKRVSDAISAGKAYRQQLNVRLGVVAKEEKEARNRAMQETRERLFIDAAREQLPKEVYFDLWRAVDAKCAQAQAA